MSSLGKSDDPSGQERGDPSSPPPSERVGLFVSIFFLGFLFLLEILSWFTEKGGIFSILSALNAVSAKAAVVDIDEKALQFPIIIGLWSSAVLIYYFLRTRFDVSKMTKSAWTFIIIIGAGFVVDGAFGESIISYWMAKQHYDRCEAGDWAQGNGKGRVWFADYVLHGIDCRKRTATVPEYRPFN